MTYVIVLLVFISTSNLVTVTKQCNKVCVDKIYNAAIKNPNVVQIKIFKKEDYFPLGHNSFVFPPILEENIN